MNTIPESREPLGDPAVRLAYRELARERTPAELDAAVLGRARQALRGGGQSRRWMRPLALAASVALCVAVVLELADRPELAGVGGNAPASPVAVHREAVESRNQKMGGVQKDKSGMLLEAQAENTLPRAPSAGTADAGLTPTPARTAPLAFDAATAERNAPEQARCPPAATTAPGPWLRCIEALEARGDATAAALERERLSRAFPAVDSGDD